MWYLTCWRYDLENTGSDPGFSHFVVWKWNVADWHTDAVKFVLFSCSIWSFGSHVLGRAHVSILLLTNSNFGRSERSVEWQGGCCSCHPGLHVRQTYPRKRLEWKYNKSVWFGGHGMERCSQSRHFVYSFTDKFSKRRSEWSSLFVTGVWELPENLAFFSVVFSGNEECVLYCVLDVDLGGMPWLIQGLRVLEVCRFTNKLLRCSLLTELNIS